ncbi:unnamed protein product [Closterium sp. Naga37s-1]|nr:unnamed protein product [Closterium sp. Naga37s-1]
MPFPSSRRYRCPCLPSHRRLFVALPSPYLRARFPCPSRSRLLPVAHPAPLPRFPCPPRFLLLPVALPYSAPRPRFPCPSRSLLLPVALPSPARRASFSCSHRSLLLFVALPCSSRSLLLFVALPSPVRRAPLLVALPSPVRRAPFSGPSHSIPTQGKHVHQPSSHRSNHALGNCHGEPGRARTLTAALQEHSQPGGTHASWQEQCLTDTLIGTLLIRPGESMKGGNGREMGGEKGEGMGGGSRYGPGGEMGGVGWALPGGMGGPRCACKGFPQQGPFCLPASLHPPIPPQPPATHLTSCTPSLPFPPVFPSVSPLVSPSLHPCPPLHFAPGTSLPFSLPPHVPYYVPQSAFPLCLSSALSVGTSSVVRLPTTSPFPATLCPPSFCPSLRVTARVGVGKMASQVER